ncbi:hypothetical protein [Streptomyces sp. CC208A]|uniref:DUF7848 domain-containing protein n=1 Tax=Streptomyces sp. CC208A TaxID=3044573 RepID=UPI0024A7CA2C|nr:hypothetical protein [Streptomyces sp. CC208A]
MTTVLRHLLWRIKPDPDRQAPTRYVQCRDCDDRSPTEVSQSECDLWAMDHSGRTNHRKYREFAASDLVTERVRAPR